jgi:hypothetical protein
MNELPPVATADAGTSKGSQANPPVAGGSSGSESLHAAAPVDGGPAIAPVRKAPAIFQHEPDSPEGIAERREHERKRKAAARAVASKMVEPPPLPADDLVNTSQAPAGREMPFNAGEAPAPVVAWTADDVKEFTDELVELSEAKRVTDFVSTAREASLPPKLIAEIERTAGYGVKTKAGLKRSVAVCVAKWANKTGLSAKHREEAALLFFMMSIKLQGFRLRSKLNGMIREEAKRSEATEKGKPK